MAMAEFFALVQPKVLFCCPFRTRPFFPSHQQLFPPLASNYPQVDLRVLFFLNAGGNRTEKSLKHKKPAKAVLVEVGGDAPKMFGHFLKKKLEKKHILWVVDLLHSVAIRHQFYYKEQISKRGDCWLGTKGHCWHQLTVHFPGIVFGALCLFSHLIFKQRCRDDSIMYVL